MHSSQAPPWVGVSRRSRHLFDATSSNQQRISSLPSYQQMSRCAAPVTSSFCVQTSAVFTSTPATWIRGELLHDSGLLSSFLLREAKLKQQSRIQINPLLGTLKPQSNRPLYNNTMIVTVAVDGWAVIFGTAIPRCTKCNCPPINGHCTNFVSFDVALQYSYLCLLKG